MTSKTEGSLAQYRKEISRFEKEHTKFAPKKDFKQITDLFQETKEAYDTQYTFMKNDLENSVGKIDKFAKMMVNLQQEMKSRDEALKKVPSNCT